VRHAADAERVMVTGGLSRPCDGMEGRTNIQSVDVTASMHQLTQNRSQ